MSLRSSPPRGAAPRQSTVDWMAARRAEKDVPPRWFWALGAASVAASLVFMGAPARPDPPPLPPPLLPPLTWWAVTQQPWFPTMAGLAALVLAGALALLWLGVTQLSLAFSPPQPQPQAPSPSPAYSSLLSAGGAAKRASLPAFSLPQPTIRAAESKGPSWAQIGATLGAVAMGAAALYAASSREPRSAAGPDRKQRVAASVSVVPTSAPRESARSMPPTRGAQDAARRHSVCSTGLRHPLDAAQPLKEATAGHTPSQQLAQWLETERSRSLRSTEESASALRRPASYHGKWPPPSPLDVPGHWVLRGDFPGKKSFGFFVCDACGKWWLSAHAFRRWEQGCKSCEHKSLPYLLWWNEQPRGVGPAHRDLNDRPHDQARCQACSMGVCLAAATYSD